MNAYKCKIIKTHIVTHAKKEDLLLIHYSYFKTALDEAKSVARIFSIRKREGVFLRGVDNQVHSNCVLLII